jgi:hypothetical protein
LICLFAPGTILSCIFFPETELSERIAYSVLLSCSLEMIFIFVISAFKISDFATALFLWSLLAIIFLVILILRAKKIKTKFEKYSLYVFLASFIGLFVRLWFLSRLQNFSDCYKYAGFIKGHVPDLGFYTGMVINRSFYVLNATNSFITFLSGAKYPLIFLWVFAYLCLIYLLFKNYKKTGMFFAVALIMAFGPIEISLNFLNYLVLVSYASVMLMVLFFKTKEPNLGALCILSALAFSVSGYTATMVAAITAAGFVAAVIIQKILENPEKFKKFAVSLLRDKRFTVFCLIFAMSVILMAIFTEMPKFTVSQLQDSSTAISYLNKSPGTPSGNSPLINAENVISPFQEPRFLGFSAMGWQSIFFLFCGFTFVIYIIFSFFRKKEISEEDKILLYCCLPICLLSLAFFWAGYPARTFSYVCFFSLLALKLPKKWLKIFLAAAVIFIGATTFLVLKDEGTFFYKSPGETSAAQDIKKTLDGRIFSDECFVNQMVLAGYYDVTGAGDKDNLTKDLFYQNNKKDFLEAVDSLNKHKVPYIAITKRMRDSFVLMVNFEQNHVLNFDLYQNNLKKVYDNGDVSIYETSVKNNGK